ncbi:hypothetical protein GIB67_012947 [Kingdonia uniflora]|uniref:RAB6-interacting golgin n=1 Tax=Kingdonia uniflora TaxID=39325 RepID=A0A7J7NGB5_9MAGN|nr:hypothetical protein GIB67_012947 [Kingdonia uniflora]
MQTQQPKNSGNIISRGGSFSMEDNEEDLSRLALTTFQAKEEEIEKKMVAVREKVRAQLGRVEEETKRLANIHDELEALTDPMRKEATIVKKKIETINRDLKPLGQSCLKKEKEYKEAFEALNEKNKEKGLLVTRLMELVSESERFRMEKLNELSKKIEYLE